MKEIWKDIPNYDGYQASNLGNIKNKKTGNILKPYENTNGYLQVELWKNGKGKKIVVHKIIANTFLSNINNLPQINHKDENKLNNNINNLEFCTAKYNSNYGTRNLRLSSPVLCVELNKKYNSIKEASKDLKIYKTSISHCCANSQHYKTAGGYHWRYIKEDG